MELGRLVCCVLYSILQLNTVLATSKLQEHFSWTALDYAYQSEIDRQGAIMSGKFIPRNNLPVGIEIWRNKLFVTVPRWRPGIPATLNYVTLDSFHVRSPKLIPYPSWESNELGNCESGLSTVYRIKADQCDRLWVLDTGTFGIENVTQLCPYSLNIFDLRTNRLIRKYQLRPEDVNAATFIANIAVDVGKTCDDAFAYMSDELGYGLIVYSWKENTSWRFFHGFFLPDPLAGNFKIDGLNFQWSTEGIFGMSLSPPKKDGSKDLFFSPLASNREFYVSTSVLKNSSKVTQEENYYDFFALQERGQKAQVTAKVMDDTTGVQLFNLIHRNAVGCWNSALPHEEKFMGIVDQDDVALIFPSDVKIDVNRNVWVMSDKMSTFLLQDLNLKEVNFRVMFAPLKILLAGTVCDSVEPVAPAVPAHDFLYSANQLRFGNYDGIDLGEALRKITLYH